MKRNIAVVSKSDETGGGASRIASGLVGLLNSYTQLLAHHWVGVPGTNSKWYTKKLHGGRWLSLVQGAFSITSRCAGFPDFFTPELLTHLAKKTTNYDLYHFHDISFTFSPISLNWLAKHKPVLWTLHDCSPFTGGCFYPMSCDAYKLQCDNCPQLSKLPLDSKFDFTGWMQRYKGAMLSSKNITLISPSRWLITEAKKSPFFDCPIHHIPNYVDQKVFRPISKVAVRNILGLPQDRKIVLLSSSHLADERKGFNYAIEALSQLNIKPFIILIGGYDNLLEKKVSAFDHVFTGYVYNDKLLAQYYAASDIFLFTSIADNLPTVILEAMACGIPTIAFNTGGVPEMITHDTHGWLAQKKDTKGLLDGLKMGFENPEKLAEWGEAALAKSLSQYTSDVFLAAHLKLYEDTLRAKNTI